MSESPIVPGFTAEESRLLHAIGDIWNAYDAKYETGEAYTADLFTQLNQTLAGQILSQKLVTHLYEINAPIGNELIDWLIASHWSQFTPEQKFSTLEYNAIDPEFHPLPIADVFCLRARQQKVILQQHSKYLKYIKITQGDYSRVTAKQKEAIIAVITTVMIATGKSFHEVLSDADSE